MSKQMGTNIQNRVYSIYQMHLIEFRQVLRDAEVANAISPVVRRHHLKEEETEKVLLELRIPCAANVARISVSLGP